WPSTVTNVLFIRRLTYEKTASLLPRIRIGSPQIDTIAWPALCPITGAASGTASRLNARPRTNTRYRDITDSSLGGFDRPAASMRSLNRRRLLAHHVAGLHHETDRAQRPDVLHRVAFHRDHVGELPGGDRAEVAAAPQRLGAAPSRGDERVRGGHP